MIRLDNIFKSYFLGDMSIPVLNDISLSIGSGEFVAIMGPSGSGKTTLLNVIGCLDSLSAGAYRLGDTLVDTRNDDQMAQLRSRHIGFVFQLFNLIPRMNALRNVELPMLYSNVPRKERTERAMAMLERVGLADRALHVPTQLSGGQQQRVAIARSLVNQPQLIVADEPTGSLDSSNGRDIMRLFSTLNEEGTTIIMVTHEQFIADYAQHTIHLRDGRIADS